MKPINVMITTLTIAALTTAIAGAQAPKQTTKPWLFPKAAATKSQSVGLTAIPMACSECKSVPVVFTRELATKPGHGRIQETRTVHQCPGCGSKMVVALKQVKTIHVCTQRDQAVADCCATTRRS